MTDDNQPRAPESSSPANDIVGEDTPAPDKAVEDQTLEKCEDDPSNADAGAPAAQPPEEENGEKTLAYADELMEKGSKAVKDSDYAEAVDCFSRALEIRVAHYGELAPECASAYYKYGCALLYKAQEETDPLVTVPKKEKCSENSPSNGTIKSGENSESSGVAAVNEATDSGVASNNDDKEDAKDDGDENDNEGSEDEEDLAEADEEDSDLDLAWKMLDIARAIVEKQPVDTLEKVDILSALGEVSLEREDIETSLSDYCKALSILEPLVEPDSRRIAELNFRICMALELGSKVEDAVPYCQRAISICKARIQRLKAEVDGSSSGIVTRDSDHDNNKSDKAQPDSSVSEKVEEVETLDGLASELEKKLEDLQQLILNPRSALSEVLKMVNAKSAGGETGVPSTMGTASSSEGGLKTSKKDATTSTFDPPAAAANGNVTHLGVVGRGVKRATLTPIGAEPSPKKPALDSSAKENSTS